MEKDTKIIIADESVEIRRQMRDTFTRAGFRVIDEARDGEEAVSKIGRSHPDVVIVDLWLSKLDGIGVIREARKLSYGHDTPPSFILISMVSNQAAFLEASRAGAELCLPKPLSYHSLCEHIQSIMN